MSNYIEDTKKINSVIKQHSTNWQYKCTTDVGNALKRFKIGHYDDDYLYLTSVRYKRHKQFDVDKIFEHNLVTPIDSRSLEDYQGRAKTLFAIDKKIYRELEKGYKKYFTHIKDKKGNDELHQLWFYKPRKKKY